MSSSILGRESLTEQDNGHHVDRLPPALPEELLLDAPEQEPSLPERMAVVLAPMTEELSVLIAERAQHRARIVEIDADIVFIERVLRPAGVMGDPPQKKRTKKSTQNKTAAHRKSAAPGETFQKVVGYVIDAREPVDVKMISVATGVNRSSTQKCVKDARAAEIIRVTHKATGPAGGREAIYYGPMPDARERLKKMSSNGTS